MALAKEVAMMVEERGAEARAVAQAGVETAEVVRAVAEARARALTERAACHASSWNTRLLRSVHSLSPQLRHHLALHSLRRG